MVVYGSTDSPLHLNFVSPLHAVTMSILTLTQAAKAAGISRPTLYRRIKSGQLSTIRQADGTKGIDSAELMRVFGTLQPVTDHTVKKEHHEMDEVLHERIKGLARESELLQRENELLRTQLANAENEKNRILGLLEQRLLETPKGKRRKGKKKGR